MGDVTQEVLVKDLYALCERLYHAEKDNRILRYELKRAQAQRDLERKWSYFTWFCVFAGITAAFWVGTKSADAQCYQIKQQQKQGEK
ncbi:hypothetical protein [Burkholderia cenocepacia]|uniref:hypothetical protein n=1 Tax=Burkholderia cenocepacia TaxID=95486 RepID=UPI002230576A|nr:hypothetical protein [Burkholderia cenocepacia]MCW3498661.1 hypothetical protein [Burkholderia cenocepacia]MCW3506251.1 hypothetical protein [Burkholderia cenocepacia]MCW3513814.1 hypothetical protein [Burkholderia cenocepacia]MCW3528964.1 hypothetical protein [Burkholderia cenocepacia]MCW3544702.1 hypothetical protein [Burkholderia cenocepacia]